MNVIFRITLVLIAGMLGAIPVVLFAFFGNTTFSLAKLVQVALFAGGIGLLGSFFGFVALIGSRSRLDQGVRPALVISAAVAFLAALYVLEVRGS